MILQTFAIRCTKAGDDPKITWKVGDWVGRATGNQPSDFQYAMVWANEQEIRFIMENYALWAKFGFEFEVVTFEAKVDD